MEEIEPVMFLMSMLSADSRYNVRSFGEGDYAANAGLKVARDALEPVKYKFPWISYADLWTLAGATAVEDMGGATLDQEASSLLLSP